MSDVTPNSETRRQEFVRRAAAGMRNSRVEVADVSAVFEGPQKVEYIMTAALGHSNVDPKIQYLIYAGFNTPQGNSQYNAAGTINTPEITTMNFQKALQKDLKSSISFDIKYGKGGNSRIQIQGEAQRSPKYTEHLQNMPQGKQCTQDISGNNYYQYACYNMIVKAHAPDNFKATVNYKNVEQQTKNATYHIYQMIKNLGYWNSDVNPLKTTPEGKIEISANAEYIQGHYMDLALTSKYGHMEIKDVQIPKWTVRAMSFYNPLKPWERINNYYTHQQYKRKWL